MRLLTANIGSYPRIGEEKDQQRHRRSLTHLDTRVISPHAFRDVEQSVVQEVIREQITMGLDEVTDGLIAWHDPISHFCKKIAGMEITSLMRYFDTNFYYRVPEIVSRPRFRESVLKPEFQFARSVSNKPIRSILTGPYTLAAHTTSRLKAFGSLAARTAFFTDVIIEEVRALIENKATVIQIDEPSLVKNMEDFPLVEKSLLKIREAASGLKLLLAVYFFPLSPAYNKLKNLPVDGLQLDFTYDSKKLFETMMKNPAKTVIGFGLINARNTKLEAIDPILKMIRHWLAHANPPYAYLTPSAGLEYLPRDSALAKIKHLVKIKNEILHTPPKEAVHA